MNGSVSMSIYGAAAGPQVDLGYGENNAQSSSLTHTNSTLNAATIRTETTGDTNIKGGNVDASDLLSMVVGGDLNIESQKDSYDRASKGMNVSAGFGFGNDPDYTSGNKAEQRALNNTVGIRKGNGDIASINGGYGASVGRIRQKETVLSSVTGGEVDIKVANNTHLKGALLAAGEQQADGHFADNGNLHLKTDTMTYTNTSNSLYSSDNSFNVSTSVGFAEGNDEQGNPETKASLGTVNSSFSMGKTNEKSKTLATLGQGNIEVTDKEHSDDPERLNRDTDKVEKGLYAVSQHAGAEMVLDTRILTEEGRKEIKEDADRTVLLGEALHDAATKGSVAVTTDAQDGQTGVFEHIQRKQDFYTAAKSFYNDPDNDKNRDILANPENYSPQEREDANQAMIFYIAKATGVKPSEVVQVLDDERRGFYSDETGKIYVSDNANQNAKETATTVAHEASHSIDAEAFGTENKSDTYKENREEYAQLIDDAFADKLDQEYASDGYDLSTITHQNSNTQVNSVTNQPRQVDNVLASNTEDYNKLDKSKGENFLPALVAVPAVAGLVTAAIANPKVQEVTKQALNNAMEGLKTVSRGIVNFFEPDAQYTDEELAIAAKTYLQMREYRDTSTNMGDWVAMDNLMQQISPEVAAAAEKLRAEGISSNTGGSEIVEGGVSNYTNPVHEGMDSSTVSVADKDQDVWTTETHVTDEKGLGTTESPADSGVEPLLVVNSNTHNNDNNNFDSTRRAVPGEIFYKTTKEATEAAQILGFVKIKEKSHGEVVYYNKKRKLYMSRDVGSGDGNGAHNGGVWKLAKSPKELGSKQTRLGTFDADLKQIGD
ncbi:hypothetical protein CSW98_07360 [Vibrio sp. HA2012]|uniref:toxin C-terminal domain-containing protein n=1 Tax=Vibrio sp. HA2012 TaxID=1971595 RepID=UPI000C2C2921|nr:toxin C-terminal domain-containing protein [Vibrio sp. HA2012]PJC86804.1 hypothetical protein CSW98_07360 [Vibrio sp. HA2012]